MKVIIKGPQKPPVDTGVFNILTVAGSKKNRDDFKSITMETTTFNDDLLKRIKKLGKVHEAVLTAVIRPSKKTKVSSVGQVKKTQDVHSILALINYVLEAWPIFAILIFFSCYVRSWVERSNLSHTSIPWMCIPQNHGE